MDFGTFSQDIEVAAQDVKIYKELACFGSLINGIFRKYGIDLSSDQKWFPIQSYLDTTNEISETFGNATMFYIGSNVIKEAMWPPNILSLEQGLNTIDEAYHMNHRGNADIGGYTARKVNDHHYIVRCHTPYPYYVDMGIIKGVCKKFSGSNSGWIITSDIEQGDKSRADDYSFNIVTPDIGLEENTEEWVNNESILLNAVLSEAYRVMNRFAQELYEAATYDPLTNLLNRREILELLEAEMSRSSRYSRPLTVFLIDVDHFKRINDTFGHQAGDAVLVTVAKEMSKVVRENDSVGRYGGEEFLLVLPECPLQQARECAERIRKNIEGLDISYGEDRISVRCSIGIALHESSTLTLKQYISQVDLALYKAKKSGRNCICVYEKDDSH